MAKKIDKTKLSGTFTKTGYADFNASSGTWLAGDDIFNFETPIKSDITLKAKWYQKEIDFKEVKGTTMSPVTGSKVFIAGRTFQIEDFWICDHEVTQAEWESIMGSNPSYFQGDDTKKKVVDGETQENRPVEQVTWYDALVYCNKRSIAENLTPCYEISDKTDPTEWGNVPTSNEATWDAVKCNWDSNGYRLPTEIEWEYAARGGDLVGTQTTYSGSDNIDDVAWCSSNSSKTHEIKKKNPNKLDLYDMSGNVCEWCWDCYDTINANTPLFGSSKGSGSVLHNGCFGDSAAYCALGVRRNGVQAYRYYYIGFRVVRSSL